jgi:hypothetical protein
MRMAFCRGFFIAAGIEGWDLVSVSFIAIGGADCDHVTYPAVDGWADTYFSFMTS